VHASHGRTARKLARLSKDVRLLTASRIGPEDIEAGRSEPFRDGAFYDWEYRRRRQDVRFYRSLVTEKGGPVLDLGCGTGRLLVPLIRAGLEVVGVDLSWSMLRRAQSRLVRLPAGVRRRANLLRGDMTRLTFRRPFAVVLVAFHGLQHVATAAQMTRALRSFAAALEPGGWLVFDLFVPAEPFLRRDPTREWDRTVFRHPGTGRRTAYTLVQRHDRRRRLLLMEMRYQALDRAGRPRGTPEVVRLCHRLWEPPEIDRLLGRSGFETLARYADFDGTPWSPGAGAATEQMVVIARTPPRDQKHAGKRRRFYPPI